MKNVFQIQVNSHQIVDFVAKSSVYTEAIEEALKSGIFKVYENNLIKIWSKSVVPKSIVSPEDLRNWCDFKMDSSMYSYGPYFYFAFYKDDIYRIWNGNKEFFYKVADNEEEYKFNETKFFGWFNVNVKATPFKEFKKSSDWILALINNPEILFQRKSDESLASIITKIATGTKIHTYEAIWSNGEIKYLFALGENSEKFNDLSEQVKSDLYYDII